MLIGVTITGGQKEWKLKGDNRLEVLGRQEQRQLGGGKFCISFLSNGTALPCHYDAMGRWKFLEPENANDVFNLEQDLILSSYTVFVNGQKRAILEKKREEIQQRIQLGEVAPEEGESKFINL